MLGLVQFAKYINAPIIAIYKVLGSQSILFYFPLSHGLKSSFFRSNDLTTIRELSGWAAFIKKSLSIFWMYKLWCRKVPRAICSTRRLGENGGFSQYFSISNVHLSWENYMGDGISHADAIEVINIYTHIY